MADISRPLANRILRGLVVGILAGIVTLGVGCFSPAFLELMRDVSIRVLDPFGQVFLRMLFFVVMPLVFSSLAAGMLQLGRLNRLGPLAGRTFLLFALNMLIGVALGLLMMDLLRPGHVLDAGTRQQLVEQFGGVARQHAETSASRPAFDLMTLVEMFMPRNLVKAVTEFQVLPLILFALLLGAAGTKLNEARRTKLQDALETVTELMTGIVHFALRLAPYAVPALIYSVIVRVGLDIVRALAFFVGGCLVIMALHLFGTMSLWLKAWGGIAPRAFFGKIKPVLITAFSTSSSSATLPASLDNARETLRLSPATAGFVLPLGATMNMSGTALYEGCVVLFIAQIFGVDLSLTAQATLLLLSVLSAVAVAGIPGGSLPLIAGLLITFGVPPEGLGIILGVDRLLDMARTTVNVGCDLVTAAIVDRQVKGTAGAG